MRELKFVHITKTAGTSIENVGRQAGIDWGRFHTEYGYWHEVLSIKADSLVERYEWFFVVRNPYDRLISEVHCRWGGFGRHAANLTQKEFNDAVRVAARFKTMVPEGGHYTPQYRYLDDRATIHVLRFENLQADFDALMKKFGLPVALDAWSLRQSKSFGVSDLDARTRDVVKTIYGPDFDHFGYDAGALG